MPKKESSILFSWEQVIRYVVVAGTIAVFLALATAYRLDAYDATGLNILKFGFAILGFLYGLKLYDYFVTVKQLEALHGKLHELVEETRDKSAILTLLSKARGDLMAGRLELDKENVTAAIQIAGDVIRDLERGADQNRQYRDAINQTLFQAYDLKAHCFFDKQMYEKLGAISDRMISLDDEEWLGYHWRGVFHLGGDYDGKHALAALEHSSVDGTKLNRAVHNLAELYLVENEFGKAKTTALGYVEEARQLQQYRPDPYYVLAEFYRRIATYASNQERDDDLLHAFSALLDDRYAKVPRNRFYDGKLIKGKLIDNMRKTGQLGNRNTKNECDLVETTILKFCAWAEGPAQQVEEVNEPQM